MIWVVAAGACVGACLLCSCGTGSIVYFKPFGIGGGAGSEVVGKWESAIGGLGNYEFKSDGTGSHQIAGFNTDFKWSIDNSEKKPILLIDPIPPKQEEADPLKMQLPKFVLLRKTHYNFTREGDTLTLFYLGRTERGLTLRKVP